MVEHVLNREVVQYRLTREVLMGGVVNLQVRNAVLWYDGLAVEVIESVVVQSLLPVDSRELLDVRIRSLLGAGVLWWQCVCVRVCLHEWVLDRCSMRSDTKGVSCRQPLTVVDGVVWFGVRV